MVRWGRLALALAFCLAVLGCGGGGQEYKYRIAVIPKGLTHEFWQSIHRGAERAAADLKDRQGLAVEVIWQGPNNEGDAQDQIKIIDRQLADRVNGIVLAPQHSQTMVPAVQRADKQGVPVVIIDSGLTDKDCFVKYVATDNYNGGRLAAEQLLKVLHADGKDNPRLILFRYAVGSESTEQREKGFEDYIAEQEAKGTTKVTWLSKDKYAGPTVDSSQKEASPLLNNLRDEGIDGIFAPNESSATGMLAAMRSLHLNRNLDTNDPDLKKKPHLVGFDSSAPLLDALRAGEVDGLVVQDPYKMGYLGLWTLVRHLEGDNVAPNGDKVQSTGEHVITRDNLDSTSTRELFDKDLQSKRQIDLPTYAK